MLSDCDGDVSEVRRVALETASNHRPPSCSFDRVRPGDLSTFLINSNKPKNVLWMVRIRKPSQLARSFGEAAQFLFRPFALQFNVPVFELPFRVQTFYDPQRPSLDIAGLH